MPEALYISGAPASQEAALLEAILHQLQELIQIQQRANLRQLPGPAGSKRNLVITVPYPTNKLRMWRITIGAGAAQLLWTNQERLALLVFNAGVATIDLSYDVGGFAANDSFPLLGGLSVAMDNYTGPLWAQATVATLLAIIELLG